MNLNLRSDILSVTKLQPTQMQTVWQL